MRILAVVTSISALLATACTHMGVPDGSPRIASAACKAKDTSTDCYILVDAWQEGDNACGVKVARSQDSVGFEKNAKDKWITWKLTDAAADAGFRFAKNGIEPKTKPDGNVALWNANFKNGGADHGGEQFKWKNQNDPQVTAAVDYLYMVNVELRRPPAPPLTCTQDPVIRNLR